MRTEKEIKEKLEEMSNIVRNGVGNEKLEYEALGACDALLWVQGRHEGMLGSLMMNLKDEKGAA